MSNEPNLFGLVANVVSDRALRTGAKVWIFGWNGDAENAQVRGISKNGRVITKYIRFKRLEKFRAAWIPECRREDVWPQFKWADKQHAADLAQAMRKREKIQIYHRDGSLIRAGQPTSAAFK